MKAVQRGARAGVQSEKVKPPSGLQWVAATTAGYATGMTLSTYLASSAVRPFLGPLLDGIPNVLLYGAVVGLGLGIAQCVVMVRGPVPIRRWLPATLAGAACGFAVAAIAGEALGNALDSTTNNVLGQGAIAAMAGAITGLSIGLGQWLTFPKRLPRAREWLIASTIGTALGAVTAGVLLGLFELPMFSAAPSTSVGAILGISTGICQGLVLRSAWKL